MRLANQVHVFYDDDRGSRLVVLARPMHEDQNAPMAPHSGDGVSGFAWAVDGLGYSLVGPPAPDALKPIANEAPQANAQLDLSAGGVARDDVAIE